MSKSDAFTHGSLMTTGDVPEQTCVHIVQKGVN